MFIWAKPTDSVLERNEIDRVYRIGVESRRYRIKGMRLRPFFSAQVVIMLPHFIKYINNNCLYQNLKIYISLEIKVKS